MLPSTRGTLLLDLRDPQNSRAWDVFVDRYRQALVSYAQRRGLQREDAEDVAQETLVAFTLAHRQGRYDPQRGRFRDWLGQIVRRRTADTFRKKMRAERQAPETTGTGLLERQVAAQPPADEQLWDEEWDRFVLERCRTEVTYEFNSKTIQAFEMLTQEERSADSVAEVLGMSRAAVYQAKWRVLRKMREISERLENAL